MENVAPRNMGRIILCPGYYCHTGQVLMFIVKYDTDCKAYEIGKIEPIKEQNSSSNRKEDLVFKLDEIFKDFALEQGLNVESILSKTCLNIVEEIAERYKKYLPEYVDYYDDYEVYLT